MRNFHKFRFELNAIRLRTSFFPDSIYGYWYTKDENVASYHSIFNIVDDLIKSITDRDFASDIMLQAFCASKKMSHEELLTAKDEFSSWWF